MELDTLEQITDLRTVWKNEATDFTPWLAEDENLLLLSKTIGVDLTLKETESNVGSFNVDILAEEEDTGRRIIIENQLEDTNHDHLGKLITYASGKNAEIVIWIVKHAREEHKRAIEWLNEHTDESASFFLIEIELWKIGDSRPAPKFNIVERPNDWAKAMRSSSKESTDGQELKLRYWEFFNSQSSTNSKFQKKFKLHNPKARGYCSLSLGKSGMHVSLTMRPSKGFVSAALYIHDNDPLFQKLHEYEEEIAAIMVEPIEWREAEKARQIISTLRLDPSDENNWQQAVEWQYDMALRIAEVFAKFVK